MTTPNPSLRRGVIGSAICPAPITISLLIILLAINALSQTKTHLHEAQFWGGYITSVRIHSKLSLWNDAHYVPGSFFIGRHGLSVHLHQQITFTGGYAWLFLSTPYSNKLRRNEHRPWGQLAFNFPVGQKYQVHQRIRYDARFRENLGVDELLPGYIFNHRLRFMFSIRRPLIGQTLAKKIPFISIGNETLLNLGKKVYFNNLDQNRTWLMAGYEIENMTFQFGYMYRFVPATPSFTYRHFHDLTIWVSQVFITKRERRKYKEELLHREP